MLVEVKLVSTNSTLANAKVISFLSYKLSNISQSYQSKKFLKPSNKQTEALEHFLSNYQEKEVNSFIPTKPDHYGQPNKIIHNQKLKNIPGLLGIKTILPIETIISNLPNIR